MNQLKNYRFHSFTTYSKFWFEELIGIFWVRDVELKIVNRKAAKDSVATATVTLPLDMRMRTRLRVTLDDGTDAGIQLPRGELLEPYDKLVGDSADNDGLVIEVLPAAETVSVVYCEDRHQFARACYHLGNRHVQLQIDDARLAYLHDHVLDEMLTGLGFTVECEQSTFEPEAGAYGGGHSHGHENNHSHQHSHEH